LPKFKVALTTGKPFYLRSEKVRGDVRASYFFGKPVAHAEVVVTGRTTGGRPEEIFRVVGTTDPNGTFHFDTGFEDRFAKERPRESDESERGQENTPFEIEVLAKDSAGHEETAVERRTVARQAINIHVFPEGGDFLEGVENILYILTAYPTGQLAVCDLQVNGTMLQSDPMGVTIFKITPRDAALVLNVKARDASGLTGTWIDEIRTWTESNDLLLRTDKAVYRTGEKLQATILSSHRRAMFFLDVLRHGQSVLTRTLQADADGHA
jgi:hypothetical protein